MEQAWDAISQSQQVRRELYSAIEQSHCSQQEAHHMVNEGLTRKLAETVTLTVSVPVYMYMLRYCWVEMSVLHGLLWMPTAMMYNYSRTEVFPVIRDIQLRVVSDFRGRSRG